jgi:hypothetical protein
LAGQVVQADKGEENKQIRKVLEQENLPCKRSITKLYLAGLSNIF